MNKRFIVPFLFAFFSGASLAQQDSTPSFDDADTDRSGDLSQQEVDAVAVQVVGIDFVSLDQNGDGTVSRDEYESAVSGASGAGSSGSGMGGSSSGSSGSDFGTDNP